MPDKNEQAGAIVRLPVSLPATTADDPMERIMGLVLDTVSPRTAREYRRALRDFIEWSHKGGSSLSKATVYAHIASLRRAGVGDSSIKQRLAAIRKFAFEAADNGLIPEETAQSIRRIENPKRLGSKTGRWLSTEEVQAMLDAPDTSTLRGKRDYAILALLLGCGLRRSEVATLRVDNLRYLSGRWVIADLTGKHARTRTIPMAAWVQDAVALWMAVSRIAFGYLFRRITVGDHIGLSALSAQSILLLVQQFNPVPGIPLAAHDLRRTFAESARAAGVPIEQISMSLGHSSISVTERYLNVRQDMARSPSDALPYGRRTQDNGQV